MPILGRDLRACRVSSRCVSSREMPSLRQLLASHAPLLVIDAASARVQVGIVGADGAARWAVSDEEAGIGVFRCIGQLQVDVAAVGAFVFCEGPGSILGIRTVAMALRTWNVIAPKPVFSFQSLALVARAPGRADVTVIADARRDSWHVFARGGPLRRVPAAELTGPLAMPEHFRHWSPLPAGVERVPYSLETLLPATADADLFRATAAPDAFLHEEPSYAPWAPQIHRPPTKSRLSP
jgi:tRNA threonylcarbamoyladenosine biosynthesis protein TsaB